LKRLKLLQLNFPVSDKAGSLTPVFAVFVLIFALPMFAGCKGKKALLERSTTAYIIGPNNIVPVDSSVANEVSQDPVRASVLIATKLNNKRVKFCSGTLLAAAKPADNMRILTNHHCFAKTDTEDKALQTILPEACTSTTVYFGFAPKIETETLQASCKKDSLRTNFAGDLAIFTLKSNPPETYQPASLWDGEDAPAGRRAFIIHYPDTPEQMALPPGGQIQLPTAQATTSDCEVVGPFDISEWDLDRTLPFSLRHTCDLIHGSSGSALFDFETHKILGINWGGLKVSFNSGTRTDNVATKASYVAAFLNDNTAAAIENANLQRANHSADSTPKESKIKNSGSNFAAGVKKATCGTAGGENNTNSVTSVFLLLICALIPATAMKHSVKRRRSVK
jgi:V8-like Glu-specific endopeptidase